MHRFLKWRDALQAAPDVAVVVGVMRDYVTTIPQEAVSALPQECQLAIGADDIQAAAVTILHCELGYKGDSATAAILHEIAHTYAAAALRITRLTKDEASV